MPERPRHNRFASMTGGIVLGLTVALLGGAFCFLLVRGYSRAKAMDAWTETPCVIERFDIVEERFSVNSPISYRIDALYSYEVEGKNFTSSKVKLVDGATSHRRRVNTLVEKFPPGKGTCFVKPDSPEMAVLKKDTKAAGYTVWFPGLFVIGGLGIVVAAVRKGLTDSEK